MRRAEIILSYQKKRPNGLQPVGILLQYRLLSVSEFSRQPESLWDYENHDLDGPFISGCRSISANIRTPIFNALEGFRTI